MSTLRSMKLATRLGLGFGVLLVILLITSVLGITRLGQLQGFVSDITDNNNEEIALVTAMRISVNRGALALREIILVSDPDESRKISENMQKFRADYDAAETKLRTMFNDPSTLPEEKAAFEKVHALKEKSRPLTDKVVELGLAQQAPQATAFLMSQARPVQMEWLQALGELMDLETRLNQDVARDAHASYESSRNLLIITTVLGVIAGIVFSFTITRSISGPISEAVGLARTVAAGDLSTRVHAQGTDEAAALLTAMVEMQGSLSRVVTNVRSGSESVATSSAEIAQGNQDLSSRTEQQASALEETAATMEQLSSQIRNNADSARQANALASSASDVAVQGGEVVGRVVQTMKEINDSSRRIADIISVIDGIAFQTNILALNAAVEAARAGEQGRGFAVVASEVRSLAGRSADAAKEIKSLINASVERVEQGTLLVDQAGSTMTEVVGAIRRVTDIVGEISSASSEQASGVAQVSEAVAQMDQATQQNAALVEQMAAAANSLKSQAGDLVGTVAIFRTDGTPVVSRATVRSSAPKSVPFKGSERRNVPSGSAAKPRAASPGPSLPKPQPTSQPKPVAVASAASGNDDWETF